MPTPPVSFDLSIKSIGSFIPTILVRLYTWGQVRTSVYSGGPFSGFFENLRNHYEYIPNLTSGPSLGMTAVESGNRLFRGAPWSCIGSSYTEYEEGEPIRQWFQISAVIDKQGLVLNGSSWNGSQNVTATPDAYTNPVGQEIAATPELDGTVGSIELTF
jgi:hypothetical protein